MIVRVLSLMLLLSWQAAILSSPDFRLGVLGAVTSIVVGLTLIVLLVSDLGDDSPDDSVDRDRLLEHLAFHTPAP